MKTLTTATLAAAFAIGTFGAAFAQSASPGAGTVQPGTTIQPGTPMQSGQTGTVGTQSGATGTQASAMSEDAIRSMLRSRGYSDISGLNRDGDQFRVSEAKRYGEEVKNIRVDARTGQIQNQQNLSERQVKELLKERGYSDVSDVRKDGNAFTAKAKQGDRNMTLRVDAQQGTVTQSSS